MSKYILASIPLLPSLVLLYIIDNDEVKVTIMKSIGISLFGYLTVDALIPTVAEYTLKRGLSGKDLGKKGTPQESTDIPEALGIVSGTVFLICTILSQLLFAKNTNQLMISNSALFSICFMIFLGYADDTLELKWRYKLILPTVASLPLLSTYSGLTATTIPIQFRFLLWSNNKLTVIGTLIDAIVTVDKDAQGAIVELSYYFLLYMSLLSVFCTNSINILAGINGLECGQAYIIAASILFFKLYDLSNGDIGDNQMFSVLMILPFISTTLGLLKYNWYPAKVFVGDTFCYFAGMTFAVIGIHGHFSKTLLLLFLPQILNFIYSTPQLFKLLPCPRHRLPRFDPSTMLMYPSTFPCRSNELQWLKQHANDTECPNLTLICLALRLFGPMTEESLTIVLLLMQLLSTAIAFYIRYTLLQI